MCNFTTHITNRVAEAVELWDFYAVFLVTWRWWRQKRYVKRLNHLTGIRCLSGWEKAKCCVVSGTDHVRNEEVLLRVNEQRNILHEIRKRKANWIGHILRRNCLLKQVIEGKIKGEIEVARRRGRRRKKLLDDLKERRGYSHLKEKSLDRTMWRCRFGGGFGPVVRQNTEWMNEWRCLTIPTSAKQMPDRAVNSCVQC